MTAGGGTAILCTSATVIHEFLPASEIFRVAEAVLRVFQKLGDYKHKQRNRMKFMIRELGWTRWREEYERELTRCRLSGEVPTLEIDPAPGGVDARLGEGRGRRRSARSRRAWRRRRSPDPGSCRPSCRCCSRATRPTPGGARRTCGRRSSSAI